MKGLVAIERFAHWLTMLGLFGLVGLYFTKDRLPPPAYYAGEVPAAPRQAATRLSPFETTAAGERYLVTPRFSYVLEGVVVSAHNADALGDIWHHDKWRDFLNVRDLCVIWGENIKNGVYRDMEFKNDSWTCRAYWPDAATGRRFHPNQLSNNHLLTDDEFIAEAILAAEPGDRIRLSGELAEYANPANGFHRGTSTTREDRGSGACETVFVRRFEVVDKANRSRRLLYAVAGWLFGLGVLGSLALLFITPARRIAG